MLKPSLVRISSMVLCIAAGSACAQVNIDSLRAIATDTNRPDSVRFTAYYDLVWDGYLFSEPDTAFELGRKLQREAKARNNNVFVARANELMAASCYVRGDMRKALLHYDTALAQHKKNRDDDGYADVITNMAGMRSALGERDEALRLYAEGLAIHERIKDSVSIANDLNSIGTVHMARGDHARAMDLYMRGLSLQEALGNQRGIATALANVGVVHVNQGDFVAALSYFRKALGIAEHLNDQHLIGKDLEEVGACQETLGDTASALASYQRSLEVRRALNDHHGLVNIRNRIGQVFASQGRTQQALELFQQNAAMAEEADLPRGLAIALVGKGDVLLTLKRTADALVAAQQASTAAAEAEDLSVQRDAAFLEYRVLHVLHRWEEALNAQTRYVSLNDSLITEENQRAVLRNEYQYAYEKQAAVDSLGHAKAMQDESLRNALQLSRERSRRNFALVIGSLLALALLAIWQRARLLRRTNTAILNAQDRLMESERAREASEVRMRIARDVHDQLGSDLTKLVMLSTEAKEVAHIGTNGLSAIASDIERIAGEANRSLGDIVWAIDPHHDSLAGLTERVRAHCERMLTWSKVAHTIDCLHEGPDRSLDPATKRDIYLMLREALNNAIKYAKAGHINVRFRTSATHVEFDVKDDGVGMNPDHGNGHGLANMRARAIRTGGQLQVDSQPGMGARIGFQAALPTG